MDTTDLIKKMRAFMNDEKAKNRLLGYEYEYTDESIVEAASLALDEINNRGLFKLNYTIKDCDPYLLRLGTAKYLISQEIASKSRNFASVNDGGVAVNREGNIELYYRLYDSVNAEFIEQLDTFKNNLNLMSGFGH